MEFIYKYKGNQCSFTLNGIEHLKKKEDFKEVFEGKVDVNKVWKDVEKARRERGKVTIVGKELEEEGGNK
jgi:hypothetical protein